jgi:hypothetical protein
MTPPIPSTDAKPITPKRQQMPTWNRPTVSPEHGVYVVLLVALLTGAAAAQQWTGATSLYQIFEIMIQIEGGTISAGEQHGRSQTSRD